LGDGLGLFGGDNLCIKLISICFELPQFGLGHAMFRFGMGDKVIKSG
jgi:hypothetical protein